MTDEQTPPDWVLIEEKQAEIDRLLIQKLIEETEK